MLLDLKGKVAVITGGSRGIGKVVAQQICNCDADVFIYARTEEELLRTEAYLSEKGCKIKAYKGDVLDLKHINKVVSNIGEKIDVLINCAGAQGEIGPFIDLDFKKWGETFEINFFGTMNWISAVLPFMKDKKKGKIINFAGGGANYSRPNFLAYGVSKAAIVRLTETLADELNSFNIQVNAVSPGTIKTKMIDEIMSAGENRVGSEYRQILDKSAKGFDLPEKAAELVSYLASDKSDWLTGKVISAIWDPWEDWRDKGPTEISEDMYVLRRIDGRNYIKNKND